MEIILQRIKTNKNYTLSRLYPAIGRLFQLDVVEPPVAGLTSGGLQALPPGRYKIYLKPDRTTMDIVPVLQKIRRSRVRFCIAPCESSSGVGEVEFNKSNYVSNACLVAGNLTSQGQFDPHPSAFSKFMCSLIVAKQLREIVYLNIK